MASTPRASTTPRPQVPGLLADESDTPSTAGLAPVPHVYALGDVCANPDKPLPALAQVWRRAGGQAGYADLMMRMLPSNNVQLRSSMSPPPATFCLASTPPDQFPLPRLLSSRAAIWPEC